MPKICGSNLNLRVESDHFLSNADHAPSHWQYQYPIRCTVDRENGQVKQIVKLRWLQIQFWQKGTEAWHIFQILCFYLKKKKDFVWRLAHKYSVDVCIQICNVCSSSLLLHRAFVLVHNAFYRVSLAKILLLNGTLEQSNLILFSCLFLM